MSTHLTHSFAAVLLAAGRGRRMRTTKQILPITLPGGERTTVIAAAFDLLAPHCGDRMIVVTGHEADAIKNALTPRRFIEAPSDADADMLHSVRIGLLRARREFPDVDAYWLHLADHPFVQQRTTEMLRRSFEEAGRAIAVMPEHAQRGGHPALIPRDIVDDILSWNGDGGLRAYWLAHPQRCRRIATDDAGTTRDLDTPEQYRESQEPR